jgi:hypothetical protein
LLGEALRRLRDRFSCVVFAGHCFVCEISFFDS